MTARKPSVKGRREKDSWVFGEVRRGGALLNKGSVLGHHLPVNRIRRCVYLKLAEGDLGTAGNLGRSASACSLAAFSFEVLRRLRIGIGAPR
jgi:hypothetical protein